MQFKSIDELKNYKAQKKLDKFNKKQAEKEIRKQYKEFVHKSCDEKCVICKSVDGLKIRNIKGNSYKHSILLCKTCRKERKQNPVNFYWKFIKSYPQILKKFQKE
jgi:phosphatidylserine decarboxylase